MLSTILSILLLVALLGLVISAYCWWMEQGPFGWLMAWTLTDDIAQIVGAICALIISLFNQD